MEDGLKNSIGNFEEFLYNKKNLAKFYYDLTGEEVNPNDINYIKIDTNLIGNGESVITFKIGLKYVTLFEVKKAIDRNDVIRFSAYLTLVFINYANKYEELNNSDKEFILPTIEAFIIYIGREKLPGMVSLDEYLPNHGESSSFQARMKVVTFENAKGIVKEFIDDNLDKE